MFECKFRGHQAADPREQRMTVYQISGSAATIVNRHKVSCR